MLIISVMLNDDFKEWEKEGVDNNMQGVIKHFSLLGGEHPCFFVSKVTWILGTLYW